MAVPLPPFWWKAQWKLLPATVRQPDFHVLLVLRLWAWRGDAVLVSPYEDGVAVLSVLVDQSPP